MRETAMFKCILFAAVAAFAVAATGFVVPAAAKGKGVASGQKMKIKGVVTRRGADTFTVRQSGASTGKGGGAGGVSGVGGVKGSAKR